MKSLKHYLWGLPLVVVALVGLTFSSLSQDVAEHQTNAPTAAAPAVIPLCQGPYAKAQARVGGFFHAINCSSGFSTITHPATGIWCLTLTTAATKPIAAQVSIEWAASLGVVLFAQYNSVNTSCGGSTASVVEVRTYKGDTGGVGSGDQIPVLDDHVAFSVLIP